MAVKIKMSDVTRDRLEAIRKRERKGAIIATSVIVVLLFVALFVTKIFIEETPEASFLVYQPEEDSSPDLRPVQDISGGTPPVAPPVNVIVSTSVDAMAVLPMDVEMSLEGVAAADPMGDVFSAGTGLGEGMGGGGGGAGMGGTKKEPSSFVGRFWDLKKTYQGAASRLDPATAVRDVLALASQFYNGGWNTGLFSPYMESKTKLYATCFYMPNCYDQEAALAYDPKKKMGLKASRWVAIYRAKVQAPVSGTFRFVGAGDSVMGVRFNGRNVLACGMHKLTAGAEGWNAYFFDEGNNSEMKQADREGLVSYSGCEYWNGLFGGFRRGETFSVESGQWYDMEVLISEIGGGNFGFCLLIENVNEEGGAKDKDGKPLYQLFRTNFIAPDATEMYENQIKYKDDDMRVLPPYDPDSMVWPAKPITPGAAR